MMTLFLFIDDSSFEINLVKEQLPEVKVLQVPEQLHEYPQMLRDNLGLFYNLSVTQEDYVKTKIYYEQIKREEIKDNFFSIQDYLISLEIKMTIFKNDLSLVPRMAQMTQKTNQFNLTTKRYSINEIKGFILNNNKIVISIEVNDKYGPSGLTGLAILCKNSSRIDTLLLSCRILGRNIEYKLIDIVFKLAKLNNIDFLKAAYIKTNKNQPYILYQLQKIINMVGALS